MTQPLLKMEAVHKAFTVPGREIRAVGGVDLEVPAGLTVGLVGESGCGKSTLGRIAVALYRPDAGRVHFDGRDLQDMSRRGLRAYRRRFQMVFQDPQAALSPRMAVGKQVAEAMAVHGLAASRPERVQRAKQILDRVDLSPDLYNRLPHELSGGQRQRVLIAKALATDPDLLVSDEPVASLDLSMQARALKLMAELTAERGMAHLLISHDIRVVKLLASRVHVMYAGRILERGPLPETLEHPAHPYTEVLVKSVPELTPKIITDSPLGEGEVAAAPDRGCPFQPRCRYSMPRCQTEDIREFQVDGPNSGRTAACFLLDK